MQNSKLERIEKRVNELAATFNPEKINFPSYGDYPSDGNFVLVENDTYYYCNAERGILISKKPAKDEDELLCWILYDITWWHCMKAVRDDGYSGAALTRRSKQMRYDIMTQLNESWGPMVKEQLNL